jgi:hypothetical protein
MSLIFAAIANDAINTPAVFGLVGATIAAVVSHMRRLRMRKAILAK